MKKHNQKGFGHLAISLIVIVVGLIGFTGWYVWQNRDDKKSSSKILETSKTKKSSPLNAPSGWGEYRDDRLSIRFAYPPEWGDISVEELSAYTTSEKTDSVLVEGAVGHYTGSFSESRNSGWVAIDKRPYIHESTGPLPQYLGAGFCEKSDGLYLEEAKIVHADKQPTPGILYFAVDSYTCLVKANSYEKIAKDRYFAVIDYSDTKGSEPDYIMGLAKIPQLKGSMIDTITFVTHESSNGSILKDILRSLESFDQ